MDNLIIDQDEAAVKDGIEWDQEAGEFVVYLDGQRIGYAQEYGAAWNVYSQALETWNAHYRRQHNRVDLAVAL